MSNKVKSDNIQWHGSEVPSELRSSRLGQKGAVVWFTGLSGSGKSTVARRVEAELLDRGVFCVVLDGDNLRHGLNRDLGFSPEDRAENIRRVREVASLMCAGNLIVLTAFISPYRADRDAAREMVGNDAFFEVHISATTQECAARDPKGLYRKAFAGEIENFTGVSAPYEPPLAPELVLETGAQDVDASAREVVEMLEERGVLEGGA